MTSSHRLKATDEAVLVGRDVEKRLPILSRPKSATCYRSTSPKPLRLIEPDIATDARAIQRCHSRQCA